MRPVVSVPSSRPSSSARPSVPSSVPSWSSVLCPSVSSCPVLVSVRQSVASSIPSSSSVLCPSVPVRPIVVVSRRRPSSVRPSRRPTNYFLHGREANCLLPINIFIRIGHFLTTPSDIFLRMIQQQDKDTTINPQRQTKIISSKCDLRPYTWIETI